VRLRVQRPHSPPTLIGATTFTYPAILRRAGSHGGQIVGKIDTAQEATDLLAEPGHYILTEFVDFRSPDGLYRKYRVFFIGQRRIFRHLIGADDWSIHAKERFAFMAKHPGLIAEERRVLESTDGNFAPGVAATLDAVREHMGLDFFGMDFGIGLDGHIVLFEANATMNFFPVRDEPPFEHIVDVIRPASLAIRELLGLDAGSNSSAG
jgi:glutathione synthase/RimK-type ligase-like ATP-grasp enzyme